MIPAFLLAQKNSSRADSELVEKLIIAYNEFDYKRAGEYLNVAFSSLDKFSQRDQKLIYQYAAFIAYQNGNTSLAKTHFWEILKIDPTFSLDPLTTPPKLQTLFQQTKISYLEDMNLRLQQVQKPQKQLQIPWRAFLFPGWEQWHRGYRLKGIILGGLASAALTGTIYSVISTQQKKQDYQNATDQQQIPSLYNTYRQHYQNQYYFAYSFLATWVVSWIDINLWSNPPTRLQFSGVVSTRNSFPAMLGLTLRF
ncbi:MAG: hypothetical protein Kow0042_02290 [Calditrichia bacterium]